METAHRRSELFAGPAHPYTQALISAIPLPDPRKERARERIVLAGDVPSPVDPPSGLPVPHPLPEVRQRAHRGRAARACVEQMPALIDRGHGHPAACHYAERKTLL